MIEILVPSKAFNTKFHERVKVPRKAEVDVLLVGYVDNDIFNRYHHADDKSNIPEYSDSQGYQL